ncbi:hypothetical protein Tco_0872679 [Tanacetum coccineum]
MLASSHYRNVSKQTTRWQQSGRSEDGRVSSQTLTSKHMDWFTAGFVVPAGLLTVSSASIIGPQTPLGLEQ